MDYSTKNVKGQWECKQHTWIRTNKELYRNNLKSCSTCVNDANFLATVKSAAFPMIVRAIIFLYLNSFLLVWGNIQKISEIAFLVFIRGTFNTWDMPLGVYDFPFLNWYIQINSIDVIIS